MATSRHEELLLDAPALGFSRFSVEGYCHRERSHRRQPVRHRTPGLGPWIFDLCSELPGSVDQRPFQDAYDGHGISGDGYIAPLSPRTLDLMAGWWAESREGFERVLAKYQLLLLFAGVPQLDKGLSPIRVRLFSSACGTRLFTTGANRLPQMSNIDSRRPCADDSLTTS
jgi:hypothetical protein